MQDNASGEAAMKCSQSPFAFPDEWREGVYQAIYQRRDIRRFRPDTVPPQVLAKILDAAHHAPSVGYMQPWNFIIIGDKRTRERVHDLSQRERIAAAQFFDEPRRSQYLSFKLEGILEAPLNICVTCDPTSAGHAVIGRNSAPETDVYSTCCAIENLWLAARAEGLGVGWVSILKLPQLRAILGIPPHVIPVAYLCLGYPEDFPKEPELETAGWRRRQSLSSTIYYDTWGCSAHSNWLDLTTLLRKEVSRRGNMKRIIDISSRISPLDETAMQAAHERQDQLTKPPGSLGRLEELSIRLAGMTGNPRPQFLRKAVIVLAGDHGVAVEGVSAYPQEVTPQMVQTFLAGGAAINVLARRASARVIVADVGVAVDLPEHPELINKKIGYGTRNMAIGPAMSLDEAVAAIAAGIEIVETEIERGLDLVATGDMGIGNTTASSAIVAAITGKPVAEVTGRGTGVDEAGWERKLRVIERATETNRPDPADPFDVLRKVGGFEIAGLVGVILAAAAHRLPVIVDGFISGAAALLATEVCPTARDYLIPAHNSVEIGHRILLERLELAPLLNLNLRLGEGTGAAIAMHLVDDAVAILNEMATFEEAGVSRREEAEAAQDLGHA